MNKKKLLIIFLLLIVIKIPAQSWYTYTNPNTNGKLPDNNVDCLATDANGNIWIGTYFSGLVKFDGTNWTNYTPSNSPLKDKTIVDLAVDKQGNVWIANYGNGVFRFNPSTNTWTQFTKESGALTDNITYKLLVDNQGYIWVGVRVTSYNSPGVLRYDGVNWVQGPVFKDNFNSYSCEALGVDKNGNVWCGTRIGLYKYDGNNWTVYGKSNTQGGLGGDYIRTIAGDANGNVWVGTTDYVNNQTVGGGLSKFNGTAWTIYKSSTHPIDDIVSAIAFRNNDVWIGTGFCGQFGNKKGVYVFNGSTFTSYQSQSTFPGDCVNDIVVDKNNNVWIGSAYGLTKYGTTVDVWNSKELIEENYLLNQNYPNPFNPATMISYYLPKATYVKLYLYDLIGNQIAILVNKEQSQGYHYLPLRAENLTSGIYFYRLEAGNYSETKKLMLVK